MHGKGTDIHTVYSGKIWWALNLVISAKMPYFLIWQVLNLAIQSLNQKPCQIFPLCSSY